MRENSFGLRFLTVAGICNSKISKVRDAVPYFIYERKIHHKDGHMKKTQINASAASLLDERDIARIN